MGVDWSEIVCLMEVSTITRLFECTYFVFTLYGRIGVPFLNLIWYCSFCYLFCHIIHVSGADLCMGRSGPSPSFDSQIKWANSTFFGLYTCKPASATVFLYMQLTQNRNKISSSIHVHVILDSLEWVTLAKMSTFFSTVTSANMLTILDCNDFSILQIAQINLNVLICVKNQFQC